MQLNFLSFFASVSYIGESELAYLRLWETMVIAMADPSTLLNKRAEILSTRRHRAKFCFDKVSNAPT